MKLRPFPIQKSKFFILNSLLLFLILASPFSILCASPFTDNGDGTVTDAATNLRWQKCSYGQGALDCSVAASTYNWQLALTYCNGLTLASKTWRLPSVNELKTLIDRSKTSGATIDTSAFPATVASLYWTSTTYASSVAAAWIVNFTNGRANGDWKSSAYYVRCVSTGP